MHCKLFRKLPIFYAITSLVSLSSIEAMDSKHSLKACELSHPATTQQEETSTIDGQKYIVPLPVSRTPQTLSPEALSKALEAKKAGQCEQVFLTADHDWVLDFDKQGSGWQFNIDNALRVLSRKGAEVTRQVAGRFHEGTDVIHYSIHSESDQSKAPHHAMEEALYEVMFKKVNH